MRQPTRPPAQLRHATFHAPFRPPASCTASGTSPPHPRTLPMDRAIVVEAFLVRSSCALPSCAACVAPRRFRPPSKGKLHWRHDRSPLSSLPFKPPFSARSRHPPGPIQGSFFSALGDGIWRRRPRRFGHVVMQTVASVVWRTPKACMEGERREWIRLGSLCLSFSVANHCGCLDVARSSNKGTSYANGRDT